LFLYTFVSAENKGVRRRATETGVCRVRSAGRLLAVWFGFGCQRARKSQSSWLVLQESIISWIDGNVNKNS
jgi:hypothetical protein